MDVTIEKLIYGGEGLAHHEGAVVFVPFVLPGERVAVEPIEKKKKFVRARAERLLKSSALRIAARCPHFGVCGGCNYQHIPYEEQLASKAAILRETLGRIGGIEWKEVISTRASPAWGYRNRGQWKIRLAGARNPHVQRDSGGTSLAIGYFRASSTELCPVEDCPILAPSLLQALLSLRELLAAGRIPKALREIEAFTSEDSAGRDARLLLTATFAGFPPKASELAQTLRQIVPGLESIVFHDPRRERMELFGPGFLNHRIGEDSYRVGHFSFFQINRFLCAELVREVVENGPGGRLAVDLFAGVGLFSVALARKFERVVAVESNPAATRDLEINSSGKGKIEIRTADAEQFLERYKEKPDLVVLDPPRAGLTPGLTKRLVAIGSERITYVSCDPPTLARDLLSLTAGGYAIVDIHLFDLFPQTFHIESIVRLQRK